MFMISKTSNKYDTLNMAHNTKHIQIKINIYVQEKWHINKTLRDKTQICKTNKKQRPAKTILFMNMFYPVPNIHSFWTFRHRTKSPLKHILSFRQLRL